MTGKSEVERRWGRFAKALAFVQSHPNDPTMATPRLALKVVLEAIAALPKPILIDGKTDYDGAMARMVSYQKAFLREYQAAAKDEAVPADVAEVAP